jgi:nuclear GTP-binding protein
VLLGIHDNIVVDSPGGTPDTDAAARSLLQDWSSGCIRFYTHPPESHGHVSARIVGDWGKAFEMVRLLICSYPMDSHDDIFVLDFFGKGRRRDRP